MRRINMKEISAPDAGSWESIARKELTLCHAQLASHMLLQATQEHLAAAGTDPGCLVHLPHTPSGLQYEEQESVSTAAQRSKSLPFCSETTSWSPGVGDKCNPIFRESCRVVLETREEPGGEPLRVDWISCSSQPTSPSIHALRPVPYIGI